MYALAKEFGIKVFPTYCKDNTVISTQGKTKQYKGMIPPLPIMDLLSYQYNTTKINLLSNKINLKEVHSYKKMNYYDNMTVGQYIE
jgi:monoamine oxidase